MSGFLTRWSRLKARATVVSALPPTSALPISAPPISAPPISAAPISASADGEPAAALPAIESLTGESDITGFLAAGVSRSLQSAALRIAWRDDPRIADFRGLADYDWDFNAEGYGRLAATDDVAGMLRRVIGEPVADDAPALALVAEVPEPVAASLRQTAEGARPTVVTEEQAVEPAEPPDPVAPVRAARHGGALPA